MDNFLKLKTSILIVGVCLLFFSVYPFDAKAGSGDNVSGFAWSENIGWINFNGSNYGVNINSDGTFSGYAWSENIGWIDFAPAGPYPSSPNYSAKANLESGQLSGWARALAYGGGWDGWIKLRGSNYGVSLDENTGDFSGWAWSDMVIGWISFNCANQGVCGSSNYKVNTSFSFNYPPEKPTIPPEYQPSGVSWSQGCSYSMAIPSFHWNYSDSDNVPPGTDPQSFYQIRIGTDSNFPVDGEGDPVPESSEFKCSGQICSAASQSTSFSPIISEWLSWSDFNTTYYWKVRVKDSNDDWSEWSNSVSFTAPRNTYPEPDFNFSPTDPAPGETVSFTDISICYDSGNNSYACKNIASNRYIWDFGDGTTCDSNTNPLCRGNATHTYSIASDFSVSLSVSDTQGECQIVKVVSGSESLPEWQEVPPSSFLKKMLSTIFLFFKDLMS
ncbi:MAG: PKD domain-containing protein [Candidatus Pacebacteria bacterium]|nr:PKD domain-containing protein [Candidatus Paceibacterota bacterium]